MTRWEKKFIKEVCSKCDFDFKNCYDKINKEILNNKCIKKYLEKQLNKYHRYMVKISNEKRINMETAVKVNKLARECIE